MGSEQQPACTRVTRCFAILSAEARTILRLLKFALFGFQTARARIVTCARASLRQLVAPSPHQAQCRAPFFGRHTAVVAQHVELVWRLPRDCLAAVDDCMKRSRGHAEGRSNAVERG